MKKTLSAFLALLLVLSLMACGGNSAQEQIPDPHQGTEPAEEQTSGTNQSEEPAQEQAPDLHRGTVEGSTYTSQFLGIRLTADGDWAIADEEQLAELSGMVLDAFSDEDIKAQLEKGGSVMDLYALNQANGSSVNITLQKLGLFDGGLMSEDDYADSQLKQLPDALASTGITVDKLEHTKATFAGQEHAVLTLEGSIQDYPLYETMVLIKSGSYIACVTAASYFEDNTGDLLAMFQPLQTQK